MRKTKMRKLLLIVILLSLLTAENVFSVEIAWMHVQHREYGRGRSSNRLSFGLLDDQGKLLTDASTVTEVKLYDSAGKPVHLSPHNFSSLVDISGYYDAKNSQWRYNSHWQFDSWFGIDILESLIPGIYRLKVTTAHGVAAERTYRFNRRIGLPIIDSHSIQLQRDSSGNLIWTWDTPLDLGYLSVNSKTQVIAAIDIYRNDQSVAYFSILIPSHMGYVFIPNGIVKKMNQKGNRFGLKVKLETRDKNNRTYSKPFVVKGKLPSTSDDR
jgi:hypothetical protein